MVPGFLELLIQVVVVVAHKMTALFHTRLATAVLAS
jgi:hypothetical protein